MLLEDILASLEVVSLDSLAGHEQTIPKNEARLREAMLNIGRLVDPLIVDKEHKIVLDGNHRLTVLNSLHCVNAACQLVDYASENIKVGSWFPATPKFPEKIGAVKCDIVDFEAGLEALSRKDAYFMAVSEVNGKKKCCLFESSDTDLQTIILEQQELLKKIEREPGLDYIEDFRAPDALSVSRTVLYRRTFTKQEIVARAKAANPFPPKSTRHIIPERVIRLNVPLGWLTEDDLESARSKLAEMVKKRISEHAIRHYTEPVLVIY